MGSHASFKQGSNIIFIILNYNFKMEKGPEGSTNDLLGNYRCFSTDGGVRFP
jgi:hypothetical protein